MPPNSSIISVSFLIYKLIHPKNSTCQYLPQLSLTYHLYWLALETFVDSLALTLAFLQPAALTRVDLRWLALTCVDLRWLIAPSFLWCWIHSHQLRLQSVDFLWLVDYKLVMFVLIDCSWLLVTYVDLSWLPLVGVLNFLFDPLTPVTSVDHHLTLLTLSHCPLSPAGFLLLVLTACYSAVSHVFLLTSTVSKVNYDSLSPLPTIFDFRWLHPMLSNHPCQLLWPLLIIVDHVDHRWPCWPSLTIVDHHWLFDSW